MKAIKINIKKRIIEFIELDKYSSIAKELSNDCGSFTTIVLDNLDVIFVDEDAPIRKESGFILDHVGYPLFGNAIILGATIEGNLVSPKSLMVELNDKISFLSNLQCCERFCHESIRTVYSKPFSKN